MSQAAYGIEAKHPIFFHWVEAWRAAAMALHLLQAVEQALQEGAKLKDRSSLQGNNRKEIK